MTGGPCYSIAIGYSIMMFSSSSFSAITGAAAGRNFLSILAFVGRSNSRNKLNIKSLHKLKKKNLNRIIFFVKSMEDKKKKKVI